MARSRFLAATLAVEFVIAVAVLASLDGSTFQFLGRSLGIKPHVDCAPAPEGPSVGSPAPILNLPRRTGAGTVSSKSLRGKPAILLLGSYT